MNFSGFKMPPRIYSRSTRESADKVRNQKHRAWVRSHACILWERKECDGRIDCAHVKTGNGATSRSKASDSKCLPLCRAHHEIQTRIGEGRFELKFGIDMNAIADKFASISPFLNPRKGSAS